VASLQVADGFDGHLLLVLAQKAQGHMGKQVVGQSHLPQAFQALGRLLDVADMNAGPVLRSWRDNGWGHPVALAQSQLRRQLRLGVDQLAQVPFDRLRQAGGGGGEERLLVAVQG
jgi:hypothetical protein